MRQRKAILTLSCLLGLSVLAIYTGKVAGKKDYTDFLVYYRAAERAKATDWTHIYNLADGASPFRYIPLTLPWFRPFAELSRQSAQVVWFYFQYLWFAAGFYFVYRALRSLRVSADRALLATFVSALMILRFCLDCFTIGQISSLLFLGFSVAFWGFCSESPALQGAGMFLPALLKIGPGFLYLLFPFGSARRQGRAFTAPFWLLVACSALAVVWLGSIDLFADLFRDWTKIVSSDSLYYDASHYGSQSVKSALLRLAKIDVLSHPQVGLILLFSAAIICAAIFVFWALRQPKTLRGRGLFFALGIFPYLWFMPETFKYSMTVLAIPIALLVVSATEDQETMSWGSLAFAALTLSLSGLDFVGPKIFFALQQSSVPLLATFYLGVEVMRLAWKDSESSRFYLELRGHFPGRRIGPWPEMPAADASLGATVLMPIPTDSEALTPESIEPWLKRLETLLDTRFRDSYELLAIPYGNAKLGPVELGLRRLRKLKIISTEENQGLPVTTRALALRRGFLVSRGQTLLAVQLEQPCEPDFYSRALDFLKTGYGLVRANRRLPESRFRVQVSLLSMVYGRHRMGLIFNRFVRSILPVRTTDTQSGAWAMTRQLACEVFAVQSSPDFLFDLELTLTAQTQAFRQIDLPVLTYLSEEKSTRRVVGETLAILLGLPALAARYRNGCYNKAPSLNKNSALTADDWGLSAGVNQGILELARAGVIRRVSMMAGCAHLETGLEELLKISGLELGLHFNLTYGRRLSGGESESPGEVFTDWLRPGARAAEGPAVRAELQAQLARLSSLKIPIGYLDGHHHIHLVPGMIDELAPVLKEHGIKRVRLPYDPKLFLTMKFPLVILSLLARSRLRAHGFEYRPCFYPQLKHFQDPGALRSRLARNPTHEIIVHPARKADVHQLPIPDSYSEGRVLEFQALQMLSISQSEPHP